MKLRATEDGQDGGSGNAGRGAPALAGRQSIDEGRVIAIPMVVGLHHRYTRVAV